MEYIVESFAPPAMGQPAVVCSATTSSRSSSMYLRSCSFSTFGGIARPGLPRRPLSTDGVRLQRLR